MSFVKFSQKLSGRTFGIGCHSVKVAILFLGLFLAGTSVSAETWRGLKVEPENRCSPYNSKDYSYSQSVEVKIINSIGKIYGPYTGRCFASRYDTDIEHIVARSEAHDSGLCAASSSVRKKFASDLLNLTLASPQVNRHQKVHYDPTEWLPQYNQCWYAGRVIAVKQKYGLSVDRREAIALQQVLAQCSSTEMIVYQCQDSAGAASSSTNSQQSSSGGALAKWDDNGNGRISCKEARKHGIAPVHRDHPAYRYMRDGDGDGVVCE